MTCILSRPHAAQLPSKAVIWNPANIKPQWYHPLLNPGLPRPDRLNASALGAYAYDYFLRFLPHFRGRPEGDLAPGTTIDFTKRMSQKLGLALLFERRVWTDFRNLLLNPTVLILYIVGQCLVKLRRPTYEIWFVSMRVSVLLAKRPKVLSLLETLLMSFINYRLRTTAKLSNVRST